MFLSHHAVKALIDPSTNAIKNATKLIFWLERILKLHLDNIIENLRLGGSEDFPRKLF